MGFKCPMCACNKSTMIDGYFTNHFHETILNKKPCGKADYIASSATICSNCGFISYYFVKPFGKREDAI